MAINWMKLGKRCVQDVRLMFGRPAGSETPAPLPLTADGLRVPVEVTGLELGAVSIEFPAVQTIAGSVAVTNFPAQPSFPASIEISNFPAAPAPVTTVSVDNFPAPPAVQEVTGVIGAVCSGTVAVSNFPAFPVSFTVANFPLPVTTVSVDNFPATQAVTGVFYPATQAVSIASCPLPSGASTSALQTAGNASVASLDGKVTECNTGAVVIASGSVAVSNFPATQTVSGAVNATCSGTVAVSAVGGTVAVSGTFFQATQPISAAALPLPSGASTEATLALIKAKTDNLDVALSTRAVTGLTDAQLRAAAVPVSGTVSATCSGTVAVSGSVAVTGAFFQTTQPVSAAALPLPAGASTEVTLSTLNGKITSCNTGAVTVATCALPSGAATEATLSAKLVTPTAKGTQAATATPVQQLKDAGRVRVAITFQSTATATADTMLSLVKSKAGVAAAGATTIPVTVGKTLCLTGAVFSLKAGAAAAAFATFNLRTDPTGTVTTADLSELRVDLGLTAATANSSSQAVVTFPEGREYSGTEQIGVSASAQATTNILSVTLLGYEY